MKDITDWDKTIPCYLSIHPANVSVLPRLVLVLFCPLQNGEKNQEHTRWEKLPSWTESVGRVERV